jgi:signal transduction histidine kinase
VIRSHLLATLVFLAACSTPNVNLPQANTRAEVMAYVDRAAALVSANGDAACESFRSREWASADWYIFMFDANGKTVCHPARPELLGRMASELTDPNGKRFGDEFMRVASAGGGWVEYVWPSGQSSTPETKSAYVKQVAASDGRTYVVGSGGYGLK